MADGEIDSCIKTSEDGYNADMAHVSPTLGSIALAQEHQPMRCIPAGNKSSWWLQRQRRPQDCLEPILGRQHPQQSDIHALTVQLSRNSLHSNSTSSCCTGTGHTGRIQCASVAQAAAVGQLARVAATGLGHWQWHGSAERAAASPAAQKRSDLAWQVSANKLFAQQEATDSYQQLLCDVLHISAVQAQLILLTSPDVVTLTHEQLTANWDKLQQLLPVKQHMLMQAILQLPDLLVRPDDTVAARLGESSEVLQRPVHKLNSKQYKWTPLLHWSLITMQPQQLVKKLVQLQQLLGLHQQQQHTSTQHRQQLQRGDGPRRHQQHIQHVQQVVSLLCDEPRLLNADPAQLISTVEALEQVCAWPVSRLLPGILQSPALLMCPADRFYQAAATLQQQLKLNEEGLALTLKRTPGALLVYADQLQGLLSELSNSLAVSTDVAADICLQEPEVLMIRPGAVGRVLTVLSSVFKLSSEELLQVVEFDPLVLCRSPGELSDSISNFRDASMSSKMWAAEYRRLMLKPVNVARALRIEPLRLQRLVYLQRQRRAQTVSLKAAVSMSGRQFIMTYPGYGRWLADRYSAGGVPKQYQEHVADSDEDEDD